VHQFVPGFPGCITTPYKTGVPKKVREERAGCNVVQGSIVGIENKASRLYGLQYHPEVQHSERGVHTLRRFLFDIARIPADWRIENVLQEELEKIRRVVCLPPPPPSLPFHLLDPHGAGNKAFMFACPNEVSWSM
jgi:Glutamine amidotransferase class-I